MARDIAVLNSHPGDIHGQQAVSTGVMKPQATQSDVRGPADVGGDHLLRDKRTLQPLTQRNRWEEVQRLCLLVYVKLYQRPIKQF